MKKLLILALGLLTICTASAFTVVFSGGDEVTNGEFYTDTDWTKEAGWTIAGGLGVATTASSDQDIYQEVLTSGEKYRVVFTVSGYSAGGVKVGCGDVYGTTRGANGTYTEKIVGDGTRFRFRAVGTTTLNIDNVIVKEVKESTNVYIDSRVIFNERFFSEAEVEADGGTVTDVTFANGKGTFNGTSSKINYNLGLNGTYSVRIRCNPTSFGGYRYLFACEGTNADGVGFVRLDVTTGNLSAQSGTKYVNGVATTSTTAGVNNEIIVTGITLTQGTGASLSLIGAKHDNALEFLGTMDLFEIYEGTLTADEVLELYQSGDTEVTRMPYSPQKIGEWTLAESDQQSDTRTLLNSSAGTSSVVSTQAYGKFDFSLYTTGSNHAKNTFISTTTDAHGSGDGYTLYSDNNNAISLRLKDDTVLFTTADSYTADDTWYFFRIERLGDGTFTVYIKGGVYSDFTLIDTVTNNTYTTSAYMVADLDVGDAIRGVHVGGFKPVSDFVDGTGTTSVTGNLVVSDKASGHNHGTWYGESRRGEYTRFDGTDDYIDVGDTGKTVNTVSFWIKPTTTSEDIIDLDGGTHTIEVSSGTITATGFSSPTIYVDGSVSSTLDTDWHHVAITTATGFSASDLDIGKETTYFDGTLASVQLFGKELSIVQINQQLTQTKPVTKWVQIGDQVWMQEYMNVGTKIDDPGSSAIATACAGHIGDVVLIPATTGIECYCISATHASCQRSGILGTTQKYCYSNLESNCDTNGALYEWQEAMDLPANCAYTDCSAQINTPHQGICPDGWHIPTDTEWKTLETQLGMCAGEGVDPDWCVDDTGYRGTDEGDKLKTVDECFGSSNCSTSGFSALLAGYRGVSGGFSSSGSYVSVWSSSQSSSTDAWRRYLRSGYSTANRNTYDKYSGFSLRCLKD